MAVDLALPDVIKAGVKRVGVKRASKVVRRHVNRGLVDISLEVRGHVRNWCSKTFEA